ncbi:MAG TPA: glycosyltransferase family 4 protein [Tepidisphaeraceae bacterium]|jgi:glycosyltransferase involved in cell wall biosynthesis|nr:glycosyltransferase family 4 protein [Tepidisphaeraceae bacterium]
MTTPTGASRWPLAYVAGIFPLLSETFVYREVRGLRQRGWPLVAVSLYETRAASPDDPDLKQDRLIAYGSELRRTLLSATAEIFFHPLRSLKTLSIAVWDAMHPGEPLAWKGRLKLPLQALAAVGLARRLREREVRHIHCHFSNAPTTIGMYAAMQLKIPFSFTGHANDIFQRRSILKIKLRRAAFVACISQWHQGWYSSRQPDPSRKYEVIRCGVDAHPGPLPERRARGKEEPLKILSVCRLVEKKGIDTLIVATAELNRRGIPARLSIAGDGPDRRRLEKVAEEQNCQDQISWLGAVSNAQVFPLLGEADIFALPCRQDSNGDRDGIPVVLMEAMASGTPVIAGDLPAIGELVEDGVSGLLVKANDSAGLADKLAMLWGDPKLRRRLAEAGRKKVESEFSLAMNLDRLERRFIAAQQS